MSNVSYRLQSKNVNKEVWGVVRYSPSTRGECRNTECHEGTSTSFYINGVIETGLLFTHLN